MNCPICSAAMRTEALDGVLGAPLAVDLCRTCQILWFDTHEDLQLSAASTLAVFKAMGEAIGKERPALHLGIRCPRCAALLLPTHDMQRSTRFQYWRCDRDRGRLITFYDFLREKDFIRPLSAQQLAELRRSIQTVNCANCGAPVDLTKGSACAHCGTPLSILDLDQPDRLIAKLQQAAERAAAAAPAAQDVPGGVAKDDTAD